FELADSFLGGVVATNPVPTFAFLLSFHDPPDYPDSSASFLLSLPFFKVPQLTALSVSIPALRIALWIVVG
ncbi:hypothetical protein Tco_1064822, partial [Tanacetum coccineum]